MSKAKQAYLNKSRADKFLLNISLPPALVKINSKTPSRGSQVSLDSLQFSIYGAVVPAIAIPDHQVHFGGLGGAVRVTGHYREPYEDLAVKFKVDNNFWNYWVIYSWLNLLSDHETGEFDASDLAPRETNKNEHDKKYESGVARRQSLGIHRQYSADMTLFSVDEYNKKQIQFDYIGAFPKTLDTIQYDYQDPDEISSGVSFAYSRMEATLL